MVKNSNDELNLQAWKAEVELPPRFQAEVWQRIAARAPARRSPFANLLQTIFAVAPRPVWAALAVAASVGSGLGLGHLAADNTRSGALQELQTRYIESIDPLSHATASL
ncbi:MAG: hypothetical protein WCP06_09925 [Verrucomicrobiota bacterium]